MGWEVEKTLLYSDPGTADYTLATSGNTIDFTLDADSPGSGMIDTGGTNDYVKANLNTINVAPYDYWGLSVVSKITQAGVATAWTTSPATCYAQGIVVGSNREQDADLNNPLPSASAGTANIVPHTLNACTFFTPKGIQGTDGLADGAALVWDDFGYYVTGVGNTGTTYMNLFSWIGQAGGAGLGGSTDGVPRVSLFDQLKINLHWKPTFTPAISVQPRIKMKIYGVGFRVRGGRHGLGG